MANELHDTARAIVADHKGILAADESPGRSRSASTRSVSSRPRRTGGSTGSCSSPRRTWRTSIGGVILYDETIRQSADDGTPFPDVSRRRLHPRNQGRHRRARPGRLPRREGDRRARRARGRLEEYRSLGARFAKWRAVITIGDGIPTVACIRANAHALARYAALCQEADIVPIVEPEVLMDADNTIERATRSRRAR